MCPIHQITSPCILISLIIGFVEEKPTHDWSDYFPRCVDVNLKCSSGATAFNVALITGQWNIAELLIKHPDFDTKEVRKTNKYRKNNLFVRSWNHVCPQAMQTNTRKLLTLRWIFNDLFFVSEMDILCWCTVEDWIFQQWNSWWDTFTDYAYTGCFF